MHLHIEPNEPTKEDPLSYVPVLLEPPFASVSTVSRGHPSKVLCFAPSLALLVLYIFTAYLRKCKMEKEKYIWTFCLSVTEFLGKKHDPICETFKIQQIGLGKRDINPHRILLKCQNILKFLALKISVIALKRKNA